MPPKGIVLPLNDRPPIRSAVGEFRLPNKRLSTSKTARSRSFQQSSGPNTLLFQVPIAGQGASDHRVPHFQRLRLSFDPVLCRFCISAGQVQPEERRTGPRQRGNTGLPPVCPQAARRRLISAREGCWGKTTRSKSFSIQLVIPVRTSPDLCTPLAVRPGLLPKRRHRRSLLQARPRESSPKGAGVSSARLF
jgi:hypothetical protein